MRIFVSCTTDDLGMFRDALCDRPAEWWGTAPGLPVLSSMLDPKAESIPPVDWSIRQASRADLVILLLGEHHGALAEEPDPDHCGMARSRLDAVAAGIPDWSGLREPQRFSYTQWEVLAAMAAGVPVLVFSPDRRSRDEDLQACRRTEEEPWLRDRQACFSRWVRSRHSEDHFANRLDLVNKVRKAILRHQRKRRISRVAMAALAVLLVLCAAAGAAYHWHVSARRARTAGQQADRLRARTLRQKYAVALGGSLAMLGRSSGGAGRPIFEKALVGLGMPQNQVDELADEYNRLDGAALDSGLDPAGLQVGTARLGENVLTRLNVIRPAPAGHIEFGRSATDLLLLLRFWDVRRDQGVLLSAGRDSLDRFQAACGGVELPEQARRRAVGIAARDLGVPARRVAAAHAVLECLSAYEMEPPASGRPKETE